MPDTLINVLECSDCGLVQRVGPSQVGRALRCGRCAGRLAGGAVLQGRLSACAMGTGALLLSIACREPVFDMHLAGRYATAGLLSGPRVLVERGLPELALVVVVTLLLAPLVHLLILGLSLVGCWLRAPHRFLFMPLGLVEAARHWSMGDVYLLGALVCYVRLLDWGQVEIGAAISALIALRVVTLVADAALAPSALWSRAPWVRPQARAAPLRAGSYLACGWCKLVNSVGEGDRCARCGRTLSARRHNSLRRTSALLLTAGLLTVPANALPVMEMVHFGRTETNTIYSGVVELVRHDLTGLAVLIFVASIVIPLIKVVVLGLLLWTTARRRKTYLLLRTRAFRFVRYVGRWSMVDVFAVTLLVSLVHVGVLANVLPRYGAVAFCAVVVLTMWATDAFDPRLMWDAAGENGPEK